MTLTPDCVYSRNVSQCKPSILYFDDVRNVKEILEKTKKGDLQCAILNPNIVLCPFQILVATQFAIDAYLNKQMKTKNLFVEILYNLSPSKKITEALKVFGLNESLSQIICVTLDQDTTTMICGLVEGKLVELKELPNDTAKTGKIKTIYGITDEELQCADLIDIIVNRMSAKTVNKA